MTVLILLTTAGAGTGPFNLLSNVDGFTTPFETGVSKSALTTPPGYTTALVPDGTTTVRVRSTGACTNFIDIVVGATPPTTTTTTTLAPTTTSTTTSGATSTLTFNFVGGNGVDTNGFFGFSLTNALPSNITITGASVSQFSDFGCVTGIGTASQAGAATIVGGNLTTTVNSNSLVCPSSYSRGSSIVVNGTPLSDGGTIVIGGTTVTVSIPNNCPNAGCVA